MRSFTKLVYKQIDEALQSVNYGNYEALHSINAALTTPTAMRSFNSCQTCLISLAGVRLFSQDCSETSEWSVSGLRAF